MINKRASSYHNISSLQDLEREKKHVQRLIQKQGVFVEKDWNEIYGFWSFVPKTSRFIKHFANNIPLNLNLLTFIIDLLRLKKK